MSAPIGSVHGYRRPAGGQRQEATTWHSTVGGIVTLTLALLLVPLASEAQLPRTIPRIAYLALAPGPSDAVSSERSEALAQGLRELGYVEGKTIIMEYWWSAGNIDQLRENAAELVRLGVHVIVTQKDTVPGMARVAVLYNPVEVSAVRQLRDTEEAARVLGLQVQALEVRGLNDFAGAFAAAHQGRADGVTVLAGPGIAEHPARLVDLAVQSRLPTMFLQRVFVEAGGLMSYAASNRAMAQRAAYYVDRILKGATPADLPVEQPTKFELVLNLKTAKALGIMFPPTLLILADEVIE